MIGITEEIRGFLLNDAMERFLRYVKIRTTSNENSSSFPSSKGQLELGKYIVNELRELNLKNIIHNEFGYIYADLPPTKGLEDTQKIGLIAHLDTSSSVNGENVIPIIHKNYDGKDIKFAKNPDINLTTNDSPQLKNYIGLDIITSQGDTLLGADDKAGISEIMAACAAWERYPELKHGPLMICFLPDEEIGRGTDKINLGKLPKVCYTIDGSEMGELEIECFDAWKVNIKFIGLNIHPGYAKNLMINAIQIACRFLSQIPEDQSPEHTEDKEGFYHLTHLQGDPEEANATLIIRDFILTNNQSRMDYIKALKELFKRRYPGLKIELTFQHQYENMFSYLEKEKRIVDLAKKAIALSGLEVKIHSIRGGTDGAQLSAKGIPTPNIFTGGLLFHSRKEYIPTLALQKTAEVIINLAELWTLE